MKGCGDIFKMMKRLEAQLVEMNNNIRKVTSFYDEKTDRLQWIADALMEKRALSKWLASENSIKRVTDQLRKTENAVYQLVPGFNGLMKRAEKIADQYKRHLDDCIMKFGGIGLVAEVFDGERETADADVFTDEKFEVTVENLKKTKRAIDRMDKVAALLALAVAPSRDLKRKHEKINERKRLGAGSLGETDAAERMRRKTLASEALLARRVGKLLEIYSDSQAKVLGALSGNTELVAKHICDAGLRKTAKTYLADPAARLSQIQTNIQTAKGE